MGSLRLPAGKSAARWASVGAILSSLALTAQAAWFTNGKDVNVIVDMTPAGKKVSHPTPQHPAYYLPVVGGIRDTGPTPAGDKPPDSNTLTHLAAVELAKEGYLSCLHTVPASGGRPAILEMTHPPSLVLVVTWGSVSPVLDGDGVLVNPREALSLISGKSTNSLTSDELADAYQAAFLDRYYIAITAFDYASYQSRPQKKICLWEAKISVSSGGAGDFGSVMAGMLQAAAPYLGREMSRPQVMTLPFVPDGKVEVGTPTVVPSDPRSN